MSKNQKLGLSTILIFIRKYPSPGTKKHIPPKGKARKSLTEKCRRLLRAYVIVPRRVFHHSNPGVFIANETSSNWEDDLNDY